MRVPIRHWTTAAMVVATYTYIVLLLAVFITHVFIPGTLFFVEIILAVLFGAGIGWYAGFLLVSYGRRLFQEPLLRTLPSAVMTKQKAYCKQIARIVIVVYALIAVGAQIVESISSDSIVVALLAVAVLICCFSVSWQLKRTFQAPLPRRQG